MEWKPRTIAYLAVATAVGAFAIVAAVTTDQALRARPGGPSRCSAGPTVGTQTPLGKIKLAPRVPDQVENFAFGGRRDIQSTSIAFVPATPLALPRGTALGTSVQDLVRSDSRHFPTEVEQLTAVATVSDRNTVTLRVCVDPERPRSPDSGTYVGTVAIDDDRLSAPVLTAVKVSLKYPDPVGPLAIALLATFAAVYLAALASSQPAYFRDWFHDHSHLSAIGFGIAGALLAYSGTYLRSADWGVGGLLDIGSLFAASFAAASAGITAHAAGANAGKSSLPAPKQVVRAEPH